MRKGFDGRLVTALQSTREIVFAKWASTPIDHNAGLDAATGLAPTNSQQVTAEIRDTIAESFTLFSRDVQSEILGEFATVMGQLHRFIHLPPVEQSVEADQARKNAVEPLILRHIDVHPEQSPTWADFLTSWQNSIDSRREQMRKATAKRKSKRS